MPANSPLRGLRLLLGGLVVLLAVIWGATYQIVTSEEKQAHESDAARAGRLADLFADHATATFRYADDYIKTLRRIYLRHHSLDEMRRYMAELPPSPNILSHITMMNADGVSILISTGTKERTPKPGIHARDRAYFKFQKANTKDTAYISTARRGRNTGILTVCLVRRIADTDGRFMGVIFAAVKGEKLLKFFETMRIGLNSTASLVGLDKRIRIRKSQKGISGVGKKIERSRLWENRAKSPKGAYRQNSIVDGVPRLWSYCKLKEVPVVAVIGTSFPDTMAAIAATRRFHYLVAVDANEVVAGCVTLAEPLGEETGISIIDNFSAGPAVRLLADETRLKQVLLNLLSSAVKFNRENGTVTVEALEAAEGFCRIGVRDTGIGIAGEDKENIFQMFQRAATSATLAREGAGIGLAVSRLLVERMGGGVGFESELDAGSLFWIDLPLASNETTA